MCVFVDGGFLKTAKTETETGCQNLTVRWFAWVYTVDTNVKVRCSVCQLLLPTGIGKFKERKTKKALTLSSQQLVLNFIFIFISAVFTWQDSFVKDINIS